MDLLLLDSNFETVTVIDIYKSLIWTDRFKECGEFELYIPLEHPIIQTIEKNLYLYNPESEHLMIVETIKIDLKNDSLNCAVVSGRSIESILDRRIVWEQTVFKAVLAADKITYIEPNMQGCLLQLFNDNLIDPVNVSRKIPNFIFEVSNDPKITELTLEAQYYGQTLYEIVTALCNEHDIGFKVTVNDNKQFVFKLVAGVDRTYDQTVNQFVIFSPGYDNLLSSNYLDSNQNLKNVTLIAGEEDTMVKDPDPDDEIVPRVTYTLMNRVNESDVIGLSRREIFTDANDVSSEDEEGETMEWGRYIAQLRQRGIDTLMSNTETKAFEGEVDPYMTFKYGKDYFLGDIVQLVNEYGHEGTAYISEFVWSYEDSGVSAYPTFKTIQKGIYEE